MSMLPMWRQNPYNIEGKLTQSGVTAGPQPANVFPSGRQSLVGVLRDIGLGRSDRVAIPEWSSHCVISAVGLLAMPLPLKEALHSRCDCAAVLVYEQWGWPYSATAIHEIQEAFPNKPIILDRVDSPSLALPFTGWRGYEIWSLAKTLGYAGGGLARRNGDFWLNHHYDSLTAEALMLKSIENMVPLDFRRAYATSADDEVLELVARGFLDMAFQEEASARKQRVALLLDASAAKDLRLRFFAAPGGTAPGLFPFALGASEKTLAYLQSHAQFLGLETARYHFNEADSVLTPRYRECLAVPTHGEVPVELLRDLAEQMSK